MVLVLTAVAAALWFGVRGAGPAPETPVVEIERPPVSRGASERIVVHVSGWVRSPGLVELAAGARVAEAVAAAGGALTDASLAALNLAAVLTDGEQVIVPGPDDSRDQALGSAVTDGKVRLNYATAEQLETLPGVGPVLAARIVEHRESFGPFGAVEDLLDVSGIGERKLASLRDLVVVP